jgi:4-amino-4-deoxy-L-arabinose transferase-like glycosyltransferase
MLSLLKSRGRLPASTRSLVGWSLFIFAAALLIYAKNTFSVAWDLTDYLAVAKRLAFDGGYLDAIGRPSFDRVAFTTYLAIVVKLFGPSLVAVAWSIYLLAACYPVAVLLLGTRLFGLEVGLIASCGFIASPSLVLWVPRHIDPVWPLLLLACVLLLLSTRSKDWLAALPAALLFCLACLTKFTAVLFLACPILMCFLHCLPGGRARAAWFTVFAVAFLCLSCIGLYALAGKNGVSGLFESSLTMATRERAFFSNFNLSGYADTGKAYEPQISFLNILRLIPQLLTGLAAYFFGSDGVWNNVPAAPLFFVCLAAAAWRCWSQRRPADMIVFAVAATFLPFAAVCGLFHLRYSQNLILITMLYLAVAATIGSLILFVFAEKARLGYLLFLCLVLGYGLAKNLPRSAALAALSRHHAVQVDLAADAVLSQVNDILAPGMIVATNDNEILNGIFWRKGDLVHFVRLPNDRVVNPNVLLNAAPDLVIVSENVGSGPSWARLAAQNGFTKLDIAIPGSRGLEVFRPAVKRNPSPE